MLRFASARLLLPSLSLLCLLALAPASHAQEAPKPTPAVQKLADQANIVYLAGKYEEALRLYNDALTQARQGKDQVGEALMLKNIGNVYSGMKQMQKALEFYNQALPLARTAGDQLTEANTLGNIGIVYANTGQAQKSLEFYSQALTLYKLAGNNSRAAKMLDEVGRIYANTGQQQKAIEFYEQSLSLYKQIGDKNKQADTLTNIGNIYHNTLGQPQKALEFFNQALPLNRQVGDKSGEALTLRNIGVAYGNLNQPQKALEFYEQALSLRRAVGDKNEEANTLDDIGRVYAQTGQPQKALELYNQALPLYRQLGDKNMEAGTLTNLGNAYAGTGQPQKALELYNQALPLHRQTGNKLFEANTLTGISAIYANTGQSQKALELYNQALPLYRQLGNKNMEAGTLTNIGRRYTDFGQPQKALELYNQALPMYKQTGDKIGEADTLTSIGLVYNDFGQPQKALELYNQALLMYRQLGNKSGEAKTLGNTGLVYIDLGQPQKALEFYQKALPMYRQLGDKSSEAKMLGNMSNAYDTLGQPQKSLAYLQQVLPIFRQIGDKNGEAGTLTNIGSVYLDTGQPQKALEFANQALPLHRQTGNKQFEANTLGNIGSVYHNTLGQQQKALKFYEQALSLYRQVGDKQHEASLLYALASVEQKLQHPRLALTRAQQAVALLEELRGNVGSQGEGRSTFLASHLNIYYQYLDLLRQTGHTAEAFALTQKTKARSLLDLLASSRIDLNAALTGEEKQQLQSLQQQAPQLNAQMLKEGVENEVGAKKRFAALQVQLTQTESQLQTLMDKLYALHPGLADQQQAHTATLADLAPLLPSDTALLEYVQTSDKELLLFVVTTQAGKPKVRLYPIAVSDAQLQKQCAAFHAACADPRKNPSTLAASLSHILLSSAQQELRGKTRLIVCPDGPLWDVPFAALQSPGRPKRSVSLWQQYELSYAYSATGMQAAANARRRHKPAEHASVLALANPYFGSSNRFGDLDGVEGQRPFERPSRPFELPSRPFERPSRPFELPSRPFELPSRPIERPSRPFELPSRQLTAAIERGKVIKALPGAQQEADAIHKLFPDAAIYTGKAAQESVVFQEAGKYKYLHFATHGFFNDAAPLLSCIVLAQPEQPLRKEVQAHGNGENNAVTIAHIAEDTAAPAEVEDGLLTARKVFGLHLNADLVTLSACNSGRGQVRTGDGIVGLTWAFFAADCPSQVVSQWSVDDAATGQLMADFYKGLKAGKSKSAALRSAALKLSKDGKHQHPYYWTPFFLMGDWR